nr:Gfo/Idh/MocA family oxidoreductase [Streptomyces sp. SBT349]
MLSDHPEFTVIAVHDPDPVATTWAIGLFPAARPLGEPGDLRPDKVDLAGVATPDHAHAATAISLLGRGISAFVEKPVCVNSGEAAAHAAVGARHAVGVEPSWIRASGIPASGGWFTERPAAEPAAGRWRLPRAAHAEATLAAVRWSPCAPRGLRTPSAT